MRGLGIPVGTSGLSSSASGVGKSPSHMGNEVGMIYECPRCGGMGSIVDFGLRTINGVERRQSWCRKCRSPNKQNGAPVLPAKKKTAKKAETFENSIDVQAEPRAGRLDIAVGSVLRSKSRSEPLTFEALKKYRTPASFVSDVVWGDWCNEVRARGLDALLVWRVAQKLGLPWSITVIDDRVGDHLDIPPRKMFSFSRTGVQKKYRTIVLVVAHLALEGGDEPVAQASDIVSLKRTDAIVGLAPKASPNDSLGFEEGDEPVAQTSDAVSSKGTGDIADLPAKDALYNDATWEQRAELLRGSELAARTMSEVANSLGLSWPSNRLDERVEDYLGKADPILS